MRNELNRLVNTVADPQTRKVRRDDVLNRLQRDSSRLFKQAFDTEMQSFFYLFTRYLAEKAQSKEL